MWFHVFPRVPKKFWMPGFGTVVDAPESPLRHLRATHASRTCTIKSFGTLARPCSSETLCSTTNLVFGSACCLSGFRQLPPGCYSHITSPVEFGQTTIRRGCSEVKCRALNRGYCVQILCFVELAGSVADNALPCDSRSAPACSVQTRLVSRSSDSTLPSGAATAPL